MAIYNQQAPEQPLDSDTLEFHSAWRTIQGEGPYAGMPAVFIRLAGCNLKCPLCDTDYTSKRERLTASSTQLIVDRLAWMGLHPYHLVVITGGEPFRQRIGGLVMILSNRGYTVQIETNGTTAPQEEDFPFGNCHIVCSPKGPTIHQRLLPYIEAYKYVVRAGEIAQDGLPTTVLGYNRSPARPYPQFDRSKIFVQPLDEVDAKANQLNLEAAAKSCMDHGYMFCLQMHKLANLP